MTQGPTFTVNQKTPASQRAFQKAKVMQFHVQNAPLNLSYSPNHQNTAANASSALDFDHQNALMQLAY